MKLAEHHKSNLSEKGYTILDLLSNEEIDLFLNHWYKIEPKIEYSDYCSIRGDDLEFNNQVNELIKQTINKKLDHYFVSYHPIEKGSVLIKGKNKHESFIDPHMDPTIVDEVNFCSYNVWIPLVDVNERNGCLHLYNNYAKVQNRIIKRPINQNYKNIIKYLDLNFWQNSKPIILKAGQALIFDHRLPHASKGNSTSIDRIAISTGLIPKNAQIVIYHQTEEMFYKNKISRYKVDHETLIAIASNSFDFTKLSFEVIRQFSWFDFFEIQVKRFYYSFINKLSKIKYDSPS